MSRSAVQRWRHNGRLRRVHAGVYAVGQRRLRREGWWNAALLAAGPGAVLSHWTAVLCWGLLAHRRTLIHVIPARRGGAEVPGIVSHRSKLAADERTRHAGFPVTSVARTLVDVAAEATDRQLGAMLDAALLNHLYDHRSLVAAIDRAHGRDGIGRLMAALAVVGDEAVRFRSTTERVLRDRLVAAGLPRAAVNASVMESDGTEHELDLLWPDARVNVEIDGPQHHMPHQRARDAARDVWLQSQGYRVVRYPAARVDADLGAIAAEIAGLLGQRAG